MPLAATPAWLQRTNRFHDPVGAARIAQFIDTLSRFPTGHLLDLGAGHGIFSRIALDLGWRVTAVDVRDERFPDDANIRWVVSDVREFDEYDDVDVVICFGLWYHLTLDDQIALAAKVAPRPMILDTHVATDVQSAQFTNEVTPIVSAQGYTGRYYDESNLQARATASWGNLSSFWPSVASLGQQMYDAGYDVFEQVGPAYRVDRGFFVARAYSEQMLAGLDDRVAAYNVIDKPDVAPSRRQPISLTPQLAPPPPAPAPAPAAAPAGPPPVLPIRTATGQFVRAARASGVRKAGQARQALARRTGR